VNLDEIEINGLAKKLVQTYNGTPFLIRTTASFTRGPNYFEIDVDVHRFSYLALVGLNGVKESLKEVPRSPDPHSRPRDSLAPPPRAQVVFDIAFVVEGHPDHELPEQLLTALRVRKMHLSHLPDFPLAL
jgi:hypothetical protein